VHPKQGVGYSKPFMFAKYPKKTKIHEKFGKAALNILLKMNKNLSFFIFICLI
jgi:hypothetical protein